MIRCAVLIAVMVLFAGCGSDGGGDESAPPCDPGVDQERCSGSTLRQACSQETSTWTPLESCGTDYVCEQSGAETSCVYVDPAACETDDDCPAGTCVGGKCLNDHCNDGELNGDEFYIDCGGSCPFGCPDGRPCKSNEGCESGCCSSDGVCAEGDGYGPQCVCKNPNAEGPACDECLSAWEGAMCEICPPKWTGAHCDECVGNWGGKFGANPNCDICPENWSGTNCDVCATQWTGEACDVCPENWGGENCHVCANRWAGEACDVCPENWGGENCHVCANELTGEACDVCPENWGGEIPTELIDASGEEVCDEGPGLATVTPEFQTQPGCTLGDSSLTGTTLLVNALVLQEPYIPFLLDTLNPIWQTDIESGNLVILFHIVSHDLEAGLIKLKAGAGAYTDCNNYSWLATPGTVSLKTNGCNFSTVAPSQIAIFTKTMSKAFIISNLEIDGALDPDTGEMRGAKFVGTLRESDTEGLVSLALDVGISELFLASGANPNSDTDCDGEFDAWHLSGQIAATPIENVTF